MRPSTRSALRRGHFTADRVFFPLAALFALIMVPLWLAGRGALSPVWHGHEMLFGYALAVVAGFLITRADTVTTVVLLVAWLAARLAVLAHGYMAALAGLSFPVVLLIRAAPVLWRGAKRAENRIAPLVLGALLFLDACWWAGALRADSSLQQRALVAATDVFALLMLIIGGRALPAAMGGYLERQGIPRRDRIRSGYELPLALLMGTSALADLNGWTVLAGLLDVVAAALTVWRARVWQLRYACARPELCALALAYLWLVPALALKGVAPLGPMVPLADALHGFTVGALGSLTIVMMARTASLRARRPLAGFGVITVAVLLLTLAALLRLAATPAFAWRGSLLWISAGLWMLAFCVLLVRLLRLSACVRRIGLKIKNN